MTGDDWVWRATGEGHREVYHRDPDCHSLAHARGTRPLRPETAEERGLRECVRCAGEIGGQREPSTLHDRLLAMDPGDVGGSA